MTRRLNGSSEVVKGGMSRAIEVPPDRHGTESTKSIVLVGQIDVRYPAVVDDDLPLDRGLDLVLPVLVPVFLFLLLLLSLPLSLDSPAGGVPLADAAAARPRCLERGRERRDGDDDSLLTSRRRDLGLPFGLDIGVPSLI